MDSWAEQRCSTCKTTKPLAEFYRDRRRPSGHCKQCKACMNAYAAVHRAKPEIKARRKAQNAAWFAGPTGKFARQRSRGLPVPTREMPDACEACGKVPTKIKLALDHCHTTGKFRGWLCANCNLGFGKLGDSYEDVLRRAEYLRRFSQK